MNPLSVRLRNCGSWRDITLDLPEGITALTGSNGAGKSTLVNAIEIALFGPEGRSLADLYPRAGAADEELVIELLFEHGEATYRVRRVYSAKGRGQSKLDLERQIFSSAEAFSGNELWEPLTLESQAETQHELEALIGINRETFRASSFVKQTEVGRFCDAPPRTRKAILADALGLQQWDGWLERARKDKRRIESELDRLAGALDRAEEELAGRGAIEADRFDAVDSVDALERSLPPTVSAALSARDALAEATRRAELRADQTTAQQRAQRALDQLRQHIALRQVEIAALDVRLEQRDAYVGEAAALPALEEELAALRRTTAEWEKRERLIDQMTRLTFDAGELCRVAETAETRANAVLAQIGEHTCDRCGQVLQRDAAERAAASYRADASSARATLVAKDEEAQVITEMLTTLPSEEPDRTMLMTLEVKISAAQQAATMLAALDEAERRRGEAAGELEQMRAGVSEREEAVAAAEANLAGLGPHDPDEQQRLAHEAAIAAEAERDRRRELDEAKATVSRYDERLRRLGQIQAETLASIISRDVLQDDLSLAVAMEKACGANGVPALIMENLAIPQLETEATRILRLLGGPAYAAELRTQRETKTSGVAETLDVVLATDDGDAVYENFSGGERARIAFALRLALAQLLAARRGSATGILVIDEIEGLDANGVAALVAVLEGLVQSVPRIVVVSHQVELRDAFERSLALENVDGHSRIAA